MPIKIQSTSDVSLDGIKVCVYGKGGIGKTTLMSTAPSPIILSCESGLLSLSGVKVPYIEVSGMDDLAEAFQFLTESKEAEQFESLCLDSISEIAEVVLGDLKRKYKDPRKAYGDLSDVLGSLVRSYRDVKGKNVVFSAKRNRVKDDDTGLTNYMPSMPGQAMTNSLPYFFDEVFYMDLFEDDEGVKHRVLYTQAAYGYEAKDRSGKLEEIERPDLTYIFNKIAGRKEVAKKVVKKSEPKPESE